MISPRLVYLAVVVLALATSARSQGCGPAVDDGFNIGCCAIPTSALPNPPAITMPCEWGVLSNCTLGYNSTCTVTLSAPIYFECDYAIILVTIAGLANTPSTTTAVLAKYARTWTEPATGGQPANVWRFLINADFAFTPTPLCPAGPCLPSCTGAPYNKPAHMVGHIDYTCDSVSTGTWKAAMSLSHLPGCIQHAFFSTCPIPALSTSNDSYHLVGPAPFTFAPPTEPQGLLVGDGLRMSTLFWGPFFYLCHGETDFFTGGSLVTTTANCFCNALPNGRWRHQNLLANASCLTFPTTLQSIPVPGTPLAPTGFAALTIGSWTGTSAFPGNRSLVVYVGVLLNNTSCSPVLSPLQIVTGVGTTSTIPGSLFTSAGTPPVSATSAIDLQNMLPLVVQTSGIPTPGLGSLFAADMILSLNTP